MRFFATQFSTMLSGLLILSSVSTGHSMNLSKNNSKIEENMPLAREEVPKDLQWNVEALYLDPNSWKLELQEVQGQQSAPKWPQLSEYKGKMHDPNAVASLFESLLTLQRKLEKLHTYAHLRQDEDLGNDSFKSDYGLISTLIHEFSLETSWIEPEFLSLPQEQFQKLLDDSKLTAYRFHLEKIGRMREHTLTPEQEELVALSGKALDASSRAFGALNNADLKFEKAVDSNGKEHPLSNGTYLSYLRSQDRTLRRTAFENLHRGFEAHSNTLCELIQGQVQGHLFVSRARKFKSCLEAALYPKNIKRAVYDNLIRSVKKHLPLMHRYIALRKKLLGVDELHVYDLYVPLVKEAETNLDYEKARDTVIASVAPLGASYQDSLKKGLMDDRWVDVHENMRKRSGAYSSGCYDSMPYILLNFHGTLNDVLTLAHEAGHSMHSLLSRTNQPYIYSQYPIFVAEVASTFNEQLLLDHLKKEAKTMETASYLLNYQIEGIRATIFRQTLFAEFELQLHEWAEQGVPLTPTLLKECYAKLNREYYGPDLVIDPELEIEWARIPHFYYNFYVYQYATGLSAALALHEKAIKDEGAKARYLEFLSSGGSKFPIDLLKVAGVDMEQPDAVHAAMNHFETLLDQFEKSL